MPKTVQITVPSSRAQDVMQAIIQMPGITGLRLNPGASIKPPGDVISLDITVRSLHDLMRFLQHEGIGLDDGTSVALSAPSTLIASSFVESICNDASEQTWEEMEVMMGRESNMTANGIATMCVSGIVATLGIATGAIHLVIGAMVIAPGFEPLTRIALGMVAGSNSCKRGLWNTLLAYITLLFSAMATALLLRVTGYSALNAGSTYLSSSTLVSYWTTITFPSIAASIAGAVGGAVLIAAGRSVLTGGVMIALALIPSMTVLGMAIIAGDWSMAGVAALRWFIECFCVIFISILVLSWKRLHVHKRASEL